MEIRCSIIVAAYNEEKNIERCLRSLINQTISNNKYEILVINDGSTDRTVQIIQEKYGAKVKIFSNPENKGLPYSINQGIRYANSRYFVRVDADDYVDPHFVEFLSYAIEQNPKYQAVACDYILVDAFEQHLQHMDSATAPIACGIIFNRQVIIDIGLYNETFLACEELELMQRFQASGCKILNLHLPLYRYKKHADRITDNSVLMATFKDKLLTSR